MKSFDRVKSEDAECQEFQLTALVYSAIVILTIGTAAPVYPIALLRVWSSILAKRILTFFLTVMGNAHPQSI